MKWANTQYIDPILRGYDVSPTVESFVKAHEGKRLFASREDYERFRIRFGDTLRPKLEEARRARQESEEQARRRRIA